MLFCRFFLHFFPSVVFKRFIVLFSFSFFRLLDFLSLYLRIFLRILLSDLQKKQSIHSIPAQKRKHFYPGSDYLFFFSNFLPGSFLKEPGRKFEKKETFRKREIKHCSFSVFLPSKGELELPLFFATHLFPTISLFSALRENASNLGERN